MGILGFCSSVCFCPSALELIKTAIEKAGFTDKVVVGMDVAASEFFIEGKYDLDFKSPPNASRHISAEELADIYQGFINNYPGVYSEPRQACQTPPNYAPQHQFSRLKLLLIPTPLKRGWVVVKMRGS